jgi:hypothetical protein
MKQIAQGLASLGRGEDKMLVHMTPGEVAGLQHLALSAGGSLTVNPHTGLPEAGFLSALLPTIAGAATMYFTGSPWGAAAAGGLTGALTNQQNPLMGGIMGGMSGYSMGSLGTALGTMAPEAGAEAAKTLAAEQGALSANGPISAAMPSANGAITPEAFRQLSLGQQQAAMASGFSRLGSGAGWNALIGNAANKDEGIKASGLGGGLKATMTAASALSPLAGYGMESMNKAKMPQAGSGTNAPGRFYNAQFTQERNPLWGQPGQPYFRQSMTGADSAVYHGARGGIVSFDQGGNVPGYDPSVPFSQFPISGPFTSPMQPRSIQSYMDGLNTSLAPPPVTQTPTTGAPVNPDGWVYDPVTHTFKPPTPKPIDPNAGNMGRQQFVESGFPAEYDPGFGGSDPNDPYGTGYGVPDVGMSDPTSIGGGGIGTPETAGMVGAEFGNAGVSDGGPGQGAGYGDIGDPYGEVGFGDIGDPYGEVGFGDIGDPYGEVGGPMAKGGGIHAGLGSIPNTYAAGGRLLKGPGDGMSDNIPAVIGGPKPQKAALADGEFVLSADVVSALGSGSTEAGAKRLYAMMDRVRKHAHGTKKQIRPYSDKVMPA